jgi:DNA-directed RNA polymerase sigma subunit (sigma70/sigma32)
MTCGVDEAYCKLPDQQRTVIGFRFGLNGEPPLTLQETGERMGLSRERVRQIECQAKERMRRLFAKRQRFNPRPRPKTASPGSSPGRTAAI